MRRYANDYDIVGGFASIGFILSNTTIAIYFESPPFVKSDVTNGPTPSKRPNENR